MKKNELLVIGGVAFITALVAFVVSGALFGSPSKNPITVPVVNKISSEFPNPKVDTAYNKFFNPNAINPTKVIQIGGSNNTQPFQGVKQ